MLALCLVFFYKKKESKDVLSAPQSYKVGNLGSEHCLVMFQGSNLRSNQIIIGSLLQALISKLKVPCRDTIACDPLCVFASRKKVHFRFVNFCESPLLIPEFENRVK